MDDIIKNILVLIGGIALGMISIPIVGQLVWIWIPLPEDVNTFNNETRQISMSLLESKHYVAPLLAHVISVFITSFFIARFAPIKKMAMISLATFCYFGLALVSHYFNSPPKWFVWTDLSLSYLPFAYFGYIVGNKQKNS